MTLTEFLLACIAEDEAEARYADEAERNWHYGSFARVLADCEAKRRIIELHPVYRGPRLQPIHSTRSPDFGCARCDALSNIDEQSIIEAGGDCETLRILALPYADHPDYREEWRP